MGGSWIVVHCWRQRHSKCCRRRAFFAHRRGKSTYSAKLEKLRVYKILVLCKFGSLCRLPTPVRKKYAAGSALTCPWSPDAFKKGPFLCPFATPSLEASRPASQPASKPASPKGAHMDGVEWRQRAPKWHPVNSHTARQWKRHALW